MLVQSAVLGPLTVGPESILRFPAGVFGFPTCREFAFLPANREGTYWLQSVEEEALAFVLIDPFLFFPDYVADLAPTDLADLGADEGSRDDVALLAIVTLPGARDERPTANLQGPLALNFGSRLGKQLALESPEFGVRCPFELRPSAS